MKRGESYEFFSRRSESGRALCRSVQRGGANEASSNATRGSAGSFSNPTVIPMALMAAVQTIMARRHACARRMVCTA